MTTHKLGQDNDMQKSLAEILIATSKLNHHEAVQVLAIAQGLLNHDVVDDESLLSLHNAK